MNRFKFLGFVNFYKTYKSFKNQVKIHKKKDRMKEINLIVYYLGHTKNAILLY